MVLDINNYHTFEAIEAYHHYLRCLSQMPTYTVSFEDPKNHPPLSDVVVMPYVGAERLTVDHQACLYLTGPKYFVLPQIFATSPRVVIKKNVSNVLVAMGGSDPRNIGLKVLRALGKTTLKLRINIVLGGFSKISDATVASALKHCNSQFAILRDCRNMAEIMSKSDMAIIGSGLTKYEAASLGLPSLVISNNAYHASIMEEFVEYATAIHLGDTDSVDDAQITEAAIRLMGDCEKRQGMSVAGRVMIDGRGVDRIFSRVVRDVCDE
jgi:spore coat polysaccharide biosynthesis predicted glycosyltransferase SpsG